MRRLRRRRRSESGAAALELAMLAPLLMTFIVVVIAAGRVVQSKGDASDIAYAAARAASLAPTAGQAQAAAQRAAEEAIADDDLSCRDVSVSLDTSEMKAGGQVTATAECKADLVDVSGFGVPSSRRFVASAAVPIDKYRDLS
jgi:Flp pilus assembly protein TadG